MKTAVIRATGAQISLAPGGISVKGASDAVKAFIRAHKPVIKAELEREEQDPIARVISHLEAMRQCVSARREEGADRDACLDLINLIDAAIIEGRDPRGDFNQYLSLLSDKAMALVVTVSGEKVMAGRELADFTRSIFPAMAVSAGAFD
jgi:hypothetical protein